MYKPHSLFSSIRLLAVILAFPLAFLSCINDGKTGEPSISLVLESTIFAESDSLLFEIYDGGPPGDSSQPIQVNKVKTPKDRRSVEIKLSNKVGKDFSIVVTGTYSNGTEEIRVYEFRESTLMPIDRTVRRIIGKDLRAITDDTLEVQLRWEPLDARNKEFTLRSLDSALVGVAGNRLTTGPIPGTALVEVTSAEGGIKDTFEVEIGVPPFTTAILPITSLKCGPCHSPGQTLNFQDSLILIRLGVAALDRLQRSPGAPGRMPLKDAPNGDLTPGELAIMLNWLKRNVIPVEKMVANDIEINLGDTAEPDLEWTPANASNRNFRLTSLDSSIIGVTANGRLVSMALGTVTVLAESREGGIRAQFKVKVVPPAFTRNVLPITTRKCAPCHDPGQTFDFQDSSVLILAGAQAMDRIERDSLAAGRMPLRAAPNGDLTPHEKAILLAWLKAKIIPLKGIFFPPADSVLVDESKLPTLTYDPPNATNKAYILTSTDTSKIGIDGARFFGKAVGQARVILQTVEGRFIDSVTVKVKPILMDSIVAHDTAAIVGDTTVPRIEFFPEKAANRAYTLSLTGASTIVALDAAGKAVVGRAAGRDTILVTSADGGKKSRFVFTVGPVKPSALSVRDTNGAIGQLVLPVVTWTPANTTNKAFTLKINPSDTAIATLSATRNQVQGKALGQARITVIAGADSTRTDTFLFTVGPVGVTGIKAAPTFQYPGVTLNARPFITFTPSNATNKGFTLKSASSTRITVASDTTIRTLKLGLTAVTVTTSDGSKTAPWNVTVIRTPFTGTIKNLTAAKCIACHSGSAYPSRNWQDSAQFVEFRAAVVTRISATDATKMPPPGSPALTTAEVKTLTDWLDVE
jgi:uncharacterized protein YjdB